VLLEKKDVLDMLRCPKSGRALEVDNSKLIGEGTEYEIVDDFPVLINFEKSVLKREDVKSLSSVTERRSYSGPMKFAKRLISSPNAITAGNVEHILNLLLEGKDKARLLVVGGGSMGQGMAPFYSDSRIELVSFDIYASPWVQFLADAHDIPLSDKSFDAVVIQAVLEHVLLPDRVVSEMHRVLKDDGIVYSETPFLQHVHEGAYDFTRYTESGHRYLFRKFELIKSGTSAGAGTQLLWSIDNFVRGISRSRNVGKAVKLLFFWLRHCDRLIPEPYNIDAASGVYFLGRKQDSEISVDEIITYYKGAQR